MKKFLLLLVMGTLAYSLSAQDVIYTITGKINDQITSIDSILVENISNNTRILFGNLPDLPDYNINLTQKAFWGATGIKKFSAAQSFIVKHNSPGLMVLACNENRPVPTSLSIFNASGQKVYGFKNRNLTKGQAVNIHLGQAGLFIIKIMSPLGVQAFKAIGAQQQKFSPVFVNVIEQAPSAHGFKSANTASDNSFSYTPGDSIRISVYKQNYYSYPAVLKIKGSQAISFSFDKSTADSTGVSDVYVNLSDTSTHAQVTNYDTTSGNVQVKYSGQQPDIKAGDVITVDLDTAGYLRKVVSVTDNNDSTVTLTTARAYLDDVFVNKEIKLNTQLIQPAVHLKSTSTYREIINALTDENGYIHPVKIIYHNAQGKLIVEDVLKDHFKDDRVSIINFNRNLAMDLYGKEGDNAHLYIKEGHASLNSNAVFEFDYKDKGSLTRDSKAKKGSLKSFMFYLDSKADFLSKIALDLKKKYEKTKTKRLTHIPKVTAKFMIPPSIPVWITFSVDLYGKYYFKSDASLHADWGFESSHTLKTGGTYTKADNNFTPINEYTPSNTVFPLNIKGDINAEARLEIYPRVDILFYDMFGPFAEIAPYVTGDYHAKMQSQATDNGSQNFLAWNSNINVGLDFRLGAELTFLGLFKKEFGPLTVNCFDKPLWSSPKNITLETTLPANVSKGDKVNLTYKVTDLLGKAAPACPVYISGDGIFDHQLTLTNIKGEIPVQWTLNTTGDNKIKAVIYSADKNIIDKVSSSVTVNSGSGGGITTGSFTDPRDGKTYKTVKIGTQTWMAENLNFKTGNSWCYDDDPKNCELYGRLYDWTTIMNGKASSDNVPSGVQGICPKGWHVPSDKEWRILESFADSKYGMNDNEWDKLGMRGYDAGLNLKSKKGWKDNGNGIDKFGFNVKPGGGRSEHNYYGGITSSASFWSSTELSNQDDAYSRSFAYNENGIGKPYYNDDGEQAAKSLRCVKDNTTINLVSDFTANTTTGTAPLTVSFTDNSTGSPSSWSWDFGDGSTSTEQNPSHTYQNAGKYTVKLTATNDQGNDTETKTDFITVNDGNNNSSSFSDNFNRKEIGNNWIVRYGNWSIDNNRLKHVGDGTFNSNFIVFKTPINYDHFVVNCKVMWLSGGYFEDGPAIGYQIWKTPTSDGTNTDDYLLSFLSSWENDRVGLLRTKRENNNTATSAEQNYNLNFNIASNVWYNFKVEAKRISGQTFQVRLFINDKLYIEKEYTLSGNKIALGGWKGEYGQEVLFDDFVIKQIKDKQNSY